MRILCNRSARFIPVCTGNITNGNGYLKRNPVYPCVYREHVCVNPMCSKRDGLSLCVQGTYNRRTLFKFSVRFIPVCTGNISQLKCKMIERTVYPCVYREHKLEGIKINEYIGLSLCVQGTLTYLSRVVD